MIPPIRGERLRDFKVVSLTGAELVKRTYEVSCLVVLRYAIERLPLHSATLHPNGRAKPKLGDMIANTLEIDGNPSIL